ncbi:MAG TPA: flagellar hook-basal body complex protein [Bryobacteraceae bacterium]|jgi:flagellar hook protein FlgE
MSSTFSIALSALKAESQAINATGNNLANLNTTGFKGSAVDFKDLFSEYLGTGGGSQYGLGVSIPITNAQYSQGSIASNSSPLSGAIQGNGFFVVNSPSGQQLYTRDGNFVQDTNGVLRTETGEAVQGWTASSAGLDTSGVPGDIVLPVGSLLAANATQNFSLNGNLDSSGTAGASTGTFSQPMQVVDSLGNTHNLTVTFTKTAGVNNAWTYDVTIPGGDLASGTAGTQQSVLTGAPGALTFNSDGTLDTSGGTSAAIAISGLADGAGDMSINWSLLNSSGDATLTQYAEASAVSSSTQDGKQAAQLTTVAIQTGGQVIATYSDGRTQVAAQLALAAIANPDSLQNVGNNNLAVSASTATPAIGTEGTGGRGTIDGSALEGSNVDMATEFTNLIVYQSGYQAASRVISTENTISQDLLNLIH